MPGFEIHEDRVVSYDEHGQRTRTVHGYVKLDESVEPLLQRLRGAPLSFFICISAHEPSVCQSGKAPYTRSDIGRITGFSERALVYASQLLLSLNFVVVCGTTATGEKMYRPSETYAWFGNERGANFAEQETPEETEVQQGVQKDAPRGAKRRVSRVQNPTHHDDDVINNSSNLTNKNIIIHDWQKAKEIFAAVGFQGPWLEDVARVSAPVERAQVWADWTEKAKEAPEQYRSPFGYVHKVYCADPMAEPPPIKSNRKKPWYHEISQYVHGTPEHTQYCREHPDEVDCECGKDLDDDQ